MLSIFRCPLEEWKWNYNHESLSEKRRRRMYIEHWMRMELILLLQNRAKSFKIVSNASLADWNYLSRIIEKVFLCGLRGKHDRNQFSPTRMVFMVLRLYGFSSTFLASTKNRLNALDSSGDSMFLIERFSIAFTANDKRLAEISRLPKTREIYLVSAYILPVSHSYGARTKNCEIS